MSGAWGGLGGITTNGPVTLVRIQVADVTLDLKERSRVDVIEARPNARQVPPPGGGPPPAWDRRFVATSESGYMALATAGDKEGAVPFRWLGAVGRQITAGDSLASMFLNGSISTDPDQGIDPLDPRPANVLDLGAGLPPFLMSRLAHAEVVGVETIDGRDAVRVAWIANASIGLRGLCWLAPELGFAVVRSDATMDPSRPGFPSHGRLSWRKRASGFVRVANLWLPRKVTYEESEAALTGGEPDRRLQREMTFEDYRVEPKLPADTFRPRLAIQAIDDLSGNFTAKPPELPPGLVARLTRAVAEGPFGRPGVGTSGEEPKVVPPPPLDSPRPALVLPEPGQGKPAGEEAATLPPPGAKPGEPLGHIYVANPLLPNGFANPNQPASALLPFQGYTPLVYPSGSVQFGQANGLRPLYEISTPADDPAKIDPKIIVPPPPGFHGPIPTINPPTNDPIQAKGPVYRFEVDGTLEGRFKADPDAIALAEQMKKAQDELLEARRVAVNFNDPAEVAAGRKIANLKTQYVQLWSAKYAKFREDSASSQTIRDEVEVYQARRDGKAAELQKSEAQRTLAQQILARNSNLKNKGPNFIGHEEVIKGEGEFAVADAEVASKKAALAESDAYLNQAKRRLGEVTAARPAPDPIADKAPRPAPANEPKGHEQDGRDGVALLQARRDGTAADLRKAEAQLEQAKLDRQRATALLERSAIGRSEFEKSATDLKVAEADVARKKADLAEADILLNQARRKGGRPEPSTSRATPPQAVSLANLRGVVESMEVQLKGQQAEIQRAEAKAAEAQFGAEQAKADVELGRGDRASKEKSLGLLEVARVELEARKDEVLEAEIRLRQARRRVEVTEAQLQRDLERAKDRLTWSEDMLKKGYVSQAVVVADRLTYDALMIQLDPKYVAKPSAPPITSQPAPPVPAAPEGQPPVLKPVPSPEGRPPEADSGPKLSIKLSGEKARFTGQSNEYKLRVANPGAARVAKVNVTASLPLQGGKLVALPPGAKFDPAARKLTWSILQLDPHQSVELGFVYDSTTPGLYEATVEATAFELQAKDTMTTEVSGIALLDIQLAQTTRVMDVGKTNYYDITIKNSGTKEATKLQLKGKLAGKLKVLKHFNVEKGEFRFNPETGVFAFPEIERLGVGRSITLSLEVQATEPGPADCHAFLSHAGEIGAEDSITSTVSGVPSSK